MPGGSSKLKKTRNSMKNNLNIPGLLTPLLSFIGLVVTNINVSSHITNMNYQPLGMLLSFPNLLVFIGVTTSSVSLAKKKRGGYIAAAILNIVAIMVIFFDSGLFVLENVIVKSLFTYGAAVICAFWAMTVQENMALQSQRR